MTRRLTEGWRSAERGDCCGGGVTRRWADKNDELLIGGTDPSPAGNSSDQIKLGDYSSLLFTFGHEKIAQPQVVFQKRNLCNHFVVLRF